VRQLVAAQVEPLGLSTQEFWTLVAVAEHASASQAELAARQHVDEATTCRVVKRLGDAGLLAAVRDPEDRRRVRLELTAPGAALAHRLVPLAAGIRSTLESALSRDEHASACAALGKVLARVEGLLETAPAPRLARHATPAPSAARPRAGGRSRSPAPRGTP
jgi:DNA-binding MarR family transcriptional regulator